MGQDNFFFIRSIISFAICFQIKLKFKNENENKNKT